MKKIYTLFTLFIMALCYNANAQNLYTPITIDNSGTALTDYQVKLTINSAALIGAGKMKLNCADIRLRSVSGQELDHWVESGCNTTTTTVWVNVPSLPVGQTVIYLMYGNPNATSASNIDNTMDQGLRVSYFSGDFGALLGTCAEADAPNYDWASGTVSLSTCPNNLDDNVSLRWEGWIINQGNGDHTFYYTTDDGSRLYLNNTLVMEHWWDQGPTQYTGYYSFSGPIAIKYEFRESGGGAVARLGWAPADGSGFTYPIPGNNLRYNKIASVEPTYTTASEVAVVYIPDVNFKAELLANAAINTNGNGEIEVTEATTYTGAIDVQNNNIADLTGIQAFVGITALNVSNNQLVTLDLTVNTALTSFNCDNNDLIVLNVKNGTNTLITSFSALSNPYLFCIQVDSQAFSTINWTNIDAQANFNGNCSTSASWCFVTIPDANFKAILLADVSINTNGDGAIQCAEAATYTGTMSVNNNNISDLTGISAFTALTQLNCNDNQLTNLDVSANTALTYLQCSDNQLTSLTVSGLTALQYLDCGNNQLTNLNVLGLTALTELFCYTNQLTSLTVSGLTALQHLECPENQLTNLNTSGCTALTDVYCYDNQITNLNLTGCVALDYLECENNLLTSLNLSGNTVLTELYCYDNLLTSLNLSSNTALTFVDCGVNQLTSLNLSTCIALTELYCYNNQLTSLDIKNGNNVNFIGFNTSNNPNLSCIQVDDATYMNTNWSAAKDAAANYNTDCSSACTVNITDNNFRSALLANASINTNADAFIQCSEAATYTGNMNIAGQGITDLTGIEAFSAITYLDCAYNNLTSLDLSTNPALTYSNCSGNQLTSLTVSANTALTTLYCTENELSSLNVSANTALEYLNCDDNQLTDLTINTNLIELYCSYNQLTSLNLTSYTALTYVQCSNNQLTDLNFSGSTALEKLYCYYNQLTNLNITGCNALEELYCNSNQLTSLNVSSYTTLTNLDCGENQLTSLNVSGCIALEELYCYNNQITNLNTTGCIALYDIDCTSNRLVSLDVSSCTALLYLYCNDNQLISLDVSANILLEDLYCYSNELITFNMSNGNNVDLNGFDVTNNPNLSCIKVDNATFMDTNWSGNKDAAATYSVDCSSFCTVNIPDYDFRSALLADAAINTNGDAFIQCTEASTYTDIINVSNYNIYDLTGIEAFTALTQLLCGNNNLTSIDVSTNTALTRLVCRGNQLTSLTVTSNTALTNLDCRENQISSLNVSANTALTRLVCRNNLLTSLTVTSNTALTYLDCSENQISSLNLSANTALDHFEGYNNQLTSLDISSNTALIYFDCWNNQISSLNVSANTGLNEFYCGENLLTSLNVSNNTALEYFYCDDNAITSLNVSANTNLKDLSCPNNALTSLDLKNGNNSNLTNFSATNNPNLSCIQVDDASYMNTNWASAKDATANYSGNCCFIPNTNVQSFTICAGENLVVGTSTYTTSNTYTDVLTAVNGCDSTVTTHLTVNPAIDITTTINTSTPDASSATANQSGASYQWIDCNNGNATIAGETNQTYDASTSGNYAVIITLNSCSKTSACVALTVGISEVSNLADQLSVYPNPFNKETTVVLPSNWINSRNATTLTITDISGKQVANYVVKNEKITIKRENLESGLYFVKIQNDTKALTQKIVLID